ncbi:MAG: hypothetical protein NPIRA02_35760 [Nitrospirales bacterium]|nr:MAG: hypothetical protein NPIRA02_35760 [Nitrospirales bacterium]
MDSIVSDPNNLEDTRIILEKDDGLFLATELASYHFGELELQERAQRPDRLLRHRLMQTAALEYDGKFASRAWVFTREFNNIQRVDSAGTSVTRNTIYGMYGLAEYSVDHEPDDYHQGLTVFTRIGLAEPRVNQIELYAGEGLVYTGLIPTREKD